MGQNGSRELKKPVVQPIVEEGSSATISYGYSGVQGWRKQMEDAHLCRVQIGDLGKNSGLFGIFDGHGGPGAANFASDNILAYLLGALKPLNEAHPSFPTLAVPEIQKAFLDIDAYMRKHVADYRTDQCMEDPGTTAAIVLLTEHHLIFAHLGDCRMFLVRDGELFFVSEDHKPDNTKEKERIEAAGGFVARGRVCNCLAVSRAFGDHLFKEVKDVPPEGQMVTARPDVTVIRRDPEHDEFIFLGCDGVFDVLRNASIAQTVKNKLLEHERLTDVCNVIVTEAMERGSTDNVSTMLVVLPAAQRLGAVGDMIDGMFEFGGDEEEEEEEEEEEAQSEEVAEIVVRGSSPTSPPAGKSPRRFSSYTGHRNDEEDETEA